MLKVIVFAILIYFVYQVAKIYFRIKSAMKGTFNGSKPAEKKYSNVEEAQFKEISDDKKSRPE